MLRFTKIKEDIISRETRGHFYGFDASILYEELKPFNARCDTNEIEILVYRIDETLPFDVEAITAVVIAHGSREQCEARRIKKENDEFNAPIFAQIKLLDESRIRSIAEPSIKDEATGETWLDYYNKQVSDLRLQLKK